MEIFIFKWLGAQVLTDYFSTSDLTEFFFRSNGFLEFKDEIIKNDFDSRLRSFPPPFVKQKYVHLY
jgi:hypothetical protein